MSEDTEERLTFGVGGMFPPDWRPKYLTGRFGDPAYYKIPCPVFDDLKAQCDDLKSPPEFSGRRTGRMRMTQNEIKVGAVYSNGKNRETVRKVLGFPACPSDLIAAICVRYLVLKGLRPEVGMSFTITRRAFAKWAHHVVDQ